MGSRDAALRDREPCTGETVKEFDTLSRDEVDHAVAAAHDAFLAWRERPIAERAAIVRRAAELMLQRADALARLVTLEMGKLIAESRAEADSRRASCATTATRGRTSRRRGRWPPTAPTPCC